VREFAVEEDDLALKRTTVLRQPATQQGCCHHWLIERATGPSSRGVCKFCTEEREFSNRLAVLPKEREESIVWRQASVMEII